MEKSSRNVVTKCITNLFRIVTIILLLIGLVVIIIEGERGSGAFGSLYTSGDTVFYPGAGNIYSYTPENGETLLIKNAEAGFVVEDGQLYYTSGHGFYVYNIDSRQSTELYRDKTGGIHFRSLIISGKNSDVCKLTLYTRYPYNGKELYLSALTKEEVADGQAQYEAFAEDQEDIIASREKYLSSEIGESVRFAWTDQMIYARFPNNPNKVSSYTYEASEDGTIAKLELATETLPYSDKGEFWENHEWTLRIFVIMIIAFVLGWGGCILKIGRKTK